MLEDLLEDLLGPPTCRLVNSVNIWNLLWLSSRLIFWTEPKNIHTSTLSSKMAKKLRDKFIFFDKSDVSFMSCTAITSKFKMRWFPNEGHYWTGKLSTDINLVPLMPDEDKTFSVSLILDLRIWWRHMHTLYTAGLHTQKEQILVKAVNCERNIFFCRSVLKKRNWNSPGWYLITLLCTWNKTFQLTGQRKQKV